MSPPGEALRLYVRREVHHASTSLILRSHQAAFLRASSCSGPWKLRFAHSHVQPVPPGNGGEPGSNPKIDLSLFNLESDPSETDDLSSEYPEVVAYLPNLVRNLPTLLRNRKAAACVSRGVWDLEL